MNTELKENIEDKQKDKILKEKINKLTLKQKRALKEIVENPQSDLRPLLLRAGYSPSSASNPKMILNEKSFSEILDIIGLNDLFLARQLKKGLTNASKPVIYEGEITGEYPDYHAKHKYLETALKVKGHLTSINQTNILAQDFDIEIINEPMTKPEIPFEKIKTP